MSVFIGSIPNCTKEDVALAKSILKESRNDSESLSSLQKYFEGMFPNKYVYLFNRGRDSLYFFLKLLNLSSDDEVIVQPFTCVSAVAPILWANCNPVYVDISKSSFNMDLEELKEKITEKCKVIVIQHTFGNIANTKKVRDLVDRINRGREYENRIYIVEDCAHIFVENYQDFDIGKYSDAVFFSFAQDKCLSSTQGSVLVIKKSPVFTNSVAQYSEVEEQGRLSSLYNASYIVHWDLIKRTYFKTIIPFTNITLGRALVVLFRTLGLIKRQADGKSIKYDGIHKMSGVQAELLQEQVKRIKLFNDHRKKISSIYDNLLRKEFVFEGKGGNEILLRYPVLVKNPNELKNRLRDIRVITGRWYSSPVYPLDKGFYKDIKMMSGMYPNNKFCCKYILNLPLNIEVDMGTAVKVCDIVNRYGECI